jgi:hypothetical protein
MFSTIRSTGSLVLVATTFGCTGSAPDRASVEKLQEADVTFGSCETTATETGFANDFFPQQRENFELLFDVDAASEFHRPIDGVIGLADGPADAFTDLGPILRFNPSGFIDARNGSTYMAEAPLRYDDTWPGFHVEWFVDFAGKQYSAWVTRDDQPTVEIARGYAFRTEQTGLDRLDVIARKIDSGQSLVQVCNVRVEPRRCDNPVAGIDWASQAFPAQSGPIRVEFDVQAFNVGLDAVFGVSSGAPDGFSDLGPIFRLNPDGQMDARNGDTYEADQRVSWETYQSYHVMMAIDLPAHRYDVSVRMPGGSAVVVATNFAFRTEQATVTTLDHIGYFVDSEFGSLDVCDPTIAY